MLHDPGLLQPEPLSPGQAIADPCLCRRHSNTQAGLAPSVGSWVLVPIRFCLSPPSVSGGYRFESECSFTPPAVLLGLLCPCCGVSFFGGIQHCPVDGYSAASCSFGVKNLPLGCHPWPEWQNAQLHPPQVV